MRPHHFIHLSGIVAALAIASSAIFAYADRPTQAAEVPQASETAVSETSVELPELNSEFVPAVVEPAVQAQEPKFGLPMKDALRRVTKKTFALEIHPETSPVPNDRFNGFHVGVDFETFEDEQETDIPVYAVCGGPLLLKQFAKGYGGYALQSCTLDGEPVTVIYGHLDLESIGIAPKHRLERGDMIGVLGEGYSEETDGVRKHLHLGVHRGTEVDIRGYVQKPEEIDKWLDVLPLIQ